MSSTAEKDHDNGSEPVADQKLVASISIQAVAIGRCLHEALENAGHSFSEGQRDERQSARKRQKINFDSGAADRIMQTFGEAIAKTQLKPDHTSAAATAPRALLRARLDHYNRVGQNWRLLIDNVKLKERAPLSVERKTRNRTSLWETGGGSGEEIAIKQQMQILSYNDV
jgi:hypothetical protein